MIIDYCDNHDNKGNCCNRTPEYIIKKQDGTKLYLCETCSQQEVEEGDEALYYSRP